MREAGATSTRSLATHRGVVLCPPHRGQSWSHCPRPRATHKGAKCRPRFIPNVWNSRPSGRWRATAAGNGLYDLDPFAATGVLDKVPDVDDAFVAGVEALEAGVMRLYGVVVTFGGWVRVGCARLLCGHEAIPSWSVPRGVSPPPGLFLFQHPYLSTPVGTFRGFFSTLQ